MNRRDFLKLGGLAAIAHAFGTARADEPTDEYFTGIDYDGDKNKNNLHDLNEIIKPHRKYFGNNESIGFGVIVTGREGKTLRTRIYDSKGDVKMEYLDVMGSVKIRDDVAGKNISKWSVFHKIEAGELSPGEYTIGWKFSWTIHENRQKISIKDMPGEQVDKEWIKMEKEDMQANIEAIKKGMRKK